MSNFICKTCRNTDSVLLYDFGQMPAVNNFIDKKNVSKELKYPMELHVCKKCWLIQLSSVPDRSSLFDYYHHVSGASVGNVSHLEDVSEFIIQLMPNKGKVLEVGCNDGTLLNFLNKKGFNVIGVDPAKNIKQPKNIKIHQDYYGTSFNLKNPKYNGSYDLIIGLNVFAHNDCFLDMLIASSDLLNENGFLLLEVAYALETICDGNFDTIYHEHVCSYSLTALDYALHKVGLKGIDVKQIPTQGGSIRVIASKKESLKKTSNNYKNTLRTELSLGISKSIFYEKLYENIGAKIKNIKSFLNKVNQRKQKLLIIGAPARGVVVMNVCNVDLKYRPVIIDDTKEKQGKVMPGVHFPIYDWNEVNFQDYDIALILSWNYAVHLNEKLQQFCFKGDVFVPFPELKKIT